jgi:hypothetical protein
LFLVRYHYTRRKQYADVLNYDPNDDSIEH